MALTTHICSQLLEKASAFTQVTLDDDYIVRDNKPDVVRVIYTHGNIQLEDVKTGNGNVWITGKLYFHVLYQSDDENRRLDSINGEVPFQEKVMMEELEDGDEVWADVWTEDLSVGIINSRKLVVRAVMNIDVKSVKELNESITCGVPQEYHYEQKKQSLQILSLVTSEKDVVHLNKELILPNARSNVHDIVFSQVDLRNREVVLQREKALIQADAQLMVLYRGESTGEFECYETTVPLLGELELPLIEGDEVFWAKLCPLDILVEPRSDFDGEARMLGLEISLGVELQVYREAEYDVLCDVYSLKKELQPKKKCFPANQLLMKNISKVRLMDQVHLEANKERILQICSCNGKLTVDRVQKSEEGILVEGVLNVHILYHTIDDKLPYAHNCSQVAFEQFIEIDGMDDKVTTRIDTQIEQLQVNLLDNAEYEVKAVLQIGVLALKQVELANIVDIEESELDMEMLQKQAGMIGCIKEKDDDLWEIAKRYHATRENILEIGNKVLVIKQIET